jgi:serine phosphatase RsbU (regulator of sigma subunit)
MPTKNLKFEKFVELMFQSGMDASQIQTEVVKYVQALETNYTETIKDLKMLVEKERNRKRKIVAENVNSVQNRNEMETLFVSCIEEVRKDIMKRRLKNEIYNRKKFQ